MNPDLFTDEPAPTADLFTDEPAPQEKTVMGAVKNAGTDALGMVKGLGNLAVETMKHPIDTPVAVVKGIPHAIVEEGKRLGAGKLLTGDFSGAASQFGDALYEKPITTIMDVLPVAGAAGKGINAGMKALGIGGKVAEVGGIADELAQAGNLADDAARAGAGVADDAARGAAAAAPEAVPTGATFQETVHNLKNQVPEAAKKPLDEVQQYLTSKYGQAAKTPGVIENIGKTLEHKGRGMRLQEIGGTPGMGRSLRDRFGEKVVNDLADLAEKKGITKGFFNWQTGEQIKNLGKTSGRTVGAIRDIATKRGAVHNIDDLITKVRAELDPVYLTGSGSAQKRAYMQALDDLKASGAGASDLAKTLTAKNALIKKNRMMQPTGAPTDVYNAASRINNELVAKFLKPAEAEAYKEALKDFAASKVFDKMYGFTYGRDMFGRSRGGPWAPWNAVKDIGGRKITEKVFSNIGKKMQATPEAYRNPLALSDDVLDSIDQALDEIIHQMGKGDVQP